MEDRTQFRKNMEDELPDPVDGVATAELHKDDRERVTYSRLEPDAELVVTDPGGIEMLMIDGSLTDGVETLRKGGWVRVPDGDTLRVQAGPDGAKLWMKTGHLRYAAAPSV